MKIERGLRMISCFMAAWCFTALVSTRQVYPILVGIAYILYVMICFSNNPLTRIGPKAWRWITVVAALVLFLLAWYDLGTALVYLTIYLQVNRLACGRSARDYLWLFAVSFFQIVLAAAITSNLSFVFILLGFLVIAPLALVMLTLHRGRLAVEKSAAGSAGVGRAIPLNGSGGGDGPRASAGLPPVFVLPRGYLLRMIGVCVAVLMVGSGFFLLIPRLAARKVFLRLRPFEEQSMTGFSDQVHASALGTVVKDRTVVLYAKVRERDQRRAYRPSHLRLRGMALNYFDGISWSRNKWARTQWRVGNRVIPHHTFPFAYDPDHNMVVEIRQKMGQTQWLFGPAFIDRIQVDMGDVMFFPALHAFHLNVQTKDSMSYTVTAYTEPPLPEIMKMTVEGGPPASGNGGGGAPLLSEAERREFTALPRTLVGKEDMRDLARELTRDATTGLERVGHISRFFRSNFKYSVESGSPGRSAYYLRNFLFRSRKGHCEAYAMAMTILCRMIDIPARVVTGFYSTEYNRVQKFFTVRQCHAHTWCEVWLDGFGWLTVDPTPPSALEEESRSFALFAGIGEYWDAWTVHWRRHIVDFSLNDQIDFMHRAYNYFRSEMSSGSILGGFLLRLKSTLAGTTDSRHETGRGVWSILMFFAVVFLSWILALRVHQRRSMLRLITGAARLGACPVDFYSHVLKALAAAGLRIRPDQTPGEFADLVVRANPALQQIIPITATYYRVRYSEDVLQPEERRIVERFLTDVAHARKRRRPAKIDPAAPSR